MTRSSISRRTVLQTASGLLVAGGLAPAFAFQNETRKEIEKDLIFRSEKPRNGEPELAKLVKSCRPLPNCFMFEATRPIQ